jgi:hypothetical protein
MEIMICKLMLLKQKIPYWYMKTMFVLLLMLNVPMFAEEVWKIVDGEISFIEKIKGGISKDDLYCVFKLNTKTGEVQYLKSTYGKGKISEQWVTLKKGSASEGSWDILIAESTLLQKVAPGDIEEEGLYCAFLIDKATGKVWRLLAFNSPKVFKVKWIQLPAPTSQGEWKIYAAEHSVAFHGRADMDRENIDSVFLIEVNSGETYRIESWYEYSTGKIKDSLVRP